MKTSVKEDFDEVCSWTNCLFSGVIKNSDWFHFKVNRTWFRKKFSQLPVSKPQSETIWFDINEFSNCSSISGIKIGGSQKPQTIENL